MIGDQEHYQALKFFFAITKSITIKTYRQTAPNNLEKLKPILFIQRMHPNFFNVKNAENDANRKEIEGSNVSNTLQLIRV